MLVLTGTPDLSLSWTRFSRRSSVSSKKSRSERFKDRGETRDCIRKPLEKIGISDATEIFDFETYRDVREIHDLTGGKPYEVQLLCHVLFRRVQEKRAKQMKLDLSLLEDVRSELENTQDIQRLPKTVYEKIGVHEQTASPALAVLTAGGNFGLWTWQFANKYILEMVGWNEEEIMNQFQ